MPDYTEAQLELLIDKSARRGAEHALNRLGIDDDNIHEVRSMLEMLHAMRKGMLNAISKLFMIAILGSAMALAGYYGFGK